MRKPSVVGTALVSVVLALVLGNAASPGAAAQCPPGQPPGRAPGNAPGEGGDSGRDSYGPGTCELLLSTSSGTAGTSVEIAGAGAGAFTDVALEFRSTPVSLGSVTADAEGHYATTVTIPRGAAPGQHGIYANGVDANGDAFTRSAVFHVTGNDADGSTESPSEPAPSSSDSSDSTAEPMPEDNESTAVASADASTTTAGAGQATAEAASEEDSGGDAETALAAADGTSGGSAVLPIVAVAVLVALAAGGSTVFVRRHRTRNV